MEHFYMNIDGWSHPDSQGRLFDFLTNQLTSPIKIAEIGIYKGRSTALLCVDLINKGIEFEYHAIDHFKGSEEHEKGIDYESMCRQNLTPIIDRINIHANDSVSQSKLYPDEYFDIVYIDGSHDYESVTDDIKHWLPKVKHGGFISGDDYTYHWTEVYKAVNEMFGKENINVICPDDVDLICAQWWVRKS